jgi:arginase family enzyme
MLSAAIQDLVLPANTYEISEDEGYRPGQVGHSIQEDNDLDAANLILLSASEYRGMGISAMATASREVRRRLYDLFLWHTEIRIADAGEIKKGETLADTCAAIRMVVKELLRAGKRVLFFGGSHDLSMAVYQAFADERMLIEATAVDALIDLDRESPLASQKFLLDMLTSEPNYIKQFSLLGFQSYFVNPNLLETIDKLRFDCYRVGKVQEKMEEVEPVIRSSHFISMDMNALAHAYAPCNALSPNGFTGQEACKLMQYAGMSAGNRVTGIFNFGQPDPGGLSAMQVAQMIWYFLDGMQKQLHEVHIEDQSGYNEYHTICAEVDTLFLQSRNTGRWWMQLPDRRFIPCTYADYLAACHNALPERWLRAQERL